MGHGDNRYFLQIEVEAPSTLVKEHWRSNNTGIIIPNGRTCQNEEEVYLTINIDGTRIRACFQISTQLHYDALLGMDIL